MMRWLSCCGQVKLLSSIYTALSDSLKRIAILLYFFWASGRSIVRREHNGVIFWFPYTLIFKLKPDLANVMAENLIGLSLFFFRV